MKKFLSLVTIILFVGFVMLTPESADAAPRLVPCNGADCSFCSLVTLGNNVINWIFGFVFIIFGVITFIAGFGLMTSGGNQTALDDAKKKLSNAVIGIVIVFAAWLVVDTLVKAVISGGDVGAALGQTGANRLGMWNEIKCGLGGQATPQAGNWSAAPLSTPSSTPPGPGYTVTVTISMSASDPAFPSTLQTYLDDCVADGGVPSATAPDPYTSECRVFP